MAKPDRFQLGARRHERIIHPGKFHRHSDILHRGHRRKQVESLQDDPDPAAPSLGQTVFVERCEIFANDRDFAGACALKSAEHRHQR